MELVSGYRDPLIEFSETMGQWHRAYQTMCNVQDQEKGRKNQGEYLGHSTRKYPMDLSPYWILHLLDCTAPPPAAIPRLKKAGVHPSELKRSEGQSILMVTDASGLPLGFDVLACGWSQAPGGGGKAMGDGVGAKSTLHIMLRLLRWCMESPMSGGNPRRPNGLRVNDRKLHGLLYAYKHKHGKGILDMKLWPQALGDWDPRKLDRDGAPEGGDAPEGQGQQGKVQAGAPAFTMRWPPTCYCHVCKKRLFPSELKPCPQCKAVLYCSDQCSTKDRTKWPEDTRHDRWCARLAGYMDQETQLADLPFSYTKEVTAVDFDLEHFLFKNKLASGYWLYWSLLVRSPKCKLQPIMEQPTNYLISWLTGHSEPYGPLKQEGDTLLCSPDPHGSLSLTKPLVSWRQYYEWRGLHLSSPVAPLLSSSLSIYYIITSLVPKDFPEMNILKKKSLRIHVIESCREFHTLLTLWELSVLLPQVTFELVFIGEGLPTWSDEKQLFMQRKNGCVTLVDTNPNEAEVVDKRSIRVKGYRRAYSLLQGPKADLVIGFKPAFPLHESWLSALPRLQLLRVPAYFCEVSELSCECSQQVMSEATGGALSPPRINPFHCPLRITGGDNMLPWYSNGFIFHLMYKPVAAVCQRHVAAAAAANGPPPEAKPANPAPEPNKLNRKQRKVAARCLLRKRK